MCKFRSGGIRIGSRSAISAITPVISGRVNVTVMASSSAIHSVFSKRRSVPGGIGKGVSGEDSHAVSLLVTSMETLSVWMCECPY